MGHVLLHHHHIRAPETVTRPLWTMQTRLNEVEFYVDHALCIDLEHPLERDDLERIFPLARTTGRSLHTHEWLPSSLESTLIDQVFTQLNFLGQAVDDKALPLTTANMHKISNLVSKIGEKLQNRMSPDEPSPGQYMQTDDGTDTGTQAVYVSRGHSPGQSQDQQMTIQHKPKATGRDTGAKPPIMPVSHMEDTRRLPEEDSDLDYARLDQLSPTDMEIRTEEPTQEIHIKEEQQREYFQQIQHLCIGAAFDFYQKHQEALNNVRDKRGKPLCQTTRGEPIQDATDLNLVQWTHLLRRIFDVKGLKKDMVSSLESFNGEIQPVDEVRHAYKKSKTKSDRDLLALVQISRCFTWQLKDWTRCACLDGLYTLLELNIRAVKRDLADLAEGWEKPKRRNTMRKPGGVPTHRQSLTWPTQWSSGSNYKLG